MKTPGLGSDFCILYVSHPEIVYIEEKKFFFNYPIFDYRVIQKLGRDMFD